MRTLSLDISKSTIITNLRFWRAAQSAASFTRLARSAPEKPGVPRAMMERSTSSEMGTLRVWTRRISSRPLTSAEACATVAADSVNFIDEDDTGSILLALLEEVAHATGANADEHFDEVR